MDRPRVGDDVFAEGHWCRVVAVRRAKDAVRGMTDAEADVFVATWRSRLGRLWEDTYYEVDAVRASDGRTVFVTLRCPQVADIRRNHRG